MIKLNLRICARDLNGIKNILKILLNNKFYSNCTGDLAYGYFDYDFVESDDLYSIDDNKEIINPDEIVDDENQFFI